MTTSDSPASERENENVTLLLEVKENLRREEAIVDRLAKREVACSMHEAKMIVKHGRCLRETEDGEIRSVNGQKSLQTASD